MAEEKAQFLKLVEDEKAKLHEEGLNLNIKLAARNMATERNKARTVEEEVVSVDDDVEDCPQNGGGLNCEKENLLKPLSESVEVQAGAEGVAEEQVQELIRSENVEESGDGQKVGEADRP